MVATAVVREIAVGIPGARFEPPGAVTSPPAERPQHVMELLRSHTNENRSENTDG